MYAIVEISGKQYKVAKDQKIEVDRLKKDKGKVSFDKVLLYAMDDKNIQIGSPYISGAVIDAEILEETKGDKLRVFKMKPKKRYSRTIGHRKALSVIKINDIKIGAPKKSPSAPAPAELTKENETAKEIAKTPEKKSTKGAKKAKK